MTDHWYETKSKRAREQTRTKHRVRARTPVLTELIVFLSFDSRNSNLYKET